GAAGSGGRFRNRPNAMGFSRGACNEAVIFTFRREVMVNDCLISGQQAVSAYRKHLYFFDFDKPAAYNAAPSTPHHPGRIPKGSSRETAWPDIPNSRTS